MPDGETKKIQKINGRIERISYTNEENAYTVMAVKVSGQKKNLTVVGTFAAPAVGEFIEVEGEFVQNFKYGPQFKAHRHSLSPPSNLNSLKKYIGSGLIKGLGPVLAGRLVDKFGEKTLVILDENPERLCEVEGLGAIRRENIINSWRKHQGLKRLLSFLAEFGLGPATGLKVLRKLGEDADKIIRKDPYCLAYEVPGVAFITADKAARSIGFSIDAPQRLGAALLFVLNKAADEGHVFLPVQELLPEVAKLLKQDALEEVFELRKKLEKVMAGLLLEGKLKSEAQNTPGGFDIYLPRLHRAENWVARDLLDILHSPSAVEVPRPEAALNWAQKTLSLNLSESQAQAVSMALDKKLLVISGGPGTGKTTITKVICAIFGALKARIALVAPTGRAARRLAEATGLAAKTVHRLLEYSPQAGGFVRGPKNRLELELLLIDEASMLDLALMKQLIGALPRTSRLILVGDHDQLPSVGPGRVLADLMESGVAAVSRLKEIHRQAEGSQIIKAAHQVREGIVPQSSQDREHGDFYFIEENDPLKIEEKIIYLAAEKIPQKLGVDPMEDIQLLTPMHKRELGTAHLNQILSKHLNPKSGQGLKRLGQTFKVGDRVIQLQNNYQREVFNGDFGRVSALDFEAQELTIDFDGRAVIYDFSDIDELSLAYAISIHKSQGSEFPVVIIVLTNAHHIMLQRNLLYTAITRGRRFVVIIGSAQALRRAASNDAELRRYSRLAYKLSLGGKSPQSR